ncbi:MAG: M23 family metallopeptidase [Candidatus Eisenbacteria sp.]|nr:M23 family metallopeptidase [Candidatus Eisenbacteria bacterium]
MQIEHGLAHCRLGDGGQAGDRSGNRRLCRARERQPSATGWIGRGGRSLGGVLRAALFGAGLCATFFLADSHPAAAAAAAQGAGDAWIPPLAPPLALTGTFGEYRTGHLHTGIDFSTGGETGMPVRAVDAGSIVRLRAGAGGYGRALYLQTERGLLAVYGHLERFAGPVEQYLRVEQGILGEYEIDLYPAPHRFRFAAGDTIAWSGATGSGPPHLHFELRDGDRPLNPFDLGLPVPDLLPPEIEGICLHALAPDAWVAGGVQGVLPPGEGETSVAVWGRVGVECRVIDRSGTTDARLAPLGIRLWLDGQVLFERRFSELDFSRGRDVGRIYGTLERKAGPWAYRLYRWPPGASADVGTVGEHEGIIDAGRLSPGDHRLGLEAWDAAGNHSECCWTLVARPPLQVRQWRAGPDGSGGWLLGVQLSGWTEGLSRPPRVAWSDGLRRGDAVCLALAEGWFSARVAGAGCVELLDHQGDALLPPVWIGDPAERAGGSAGAGEVRVAVVTTEGMLALEVLPETPWGGLPEAVLVSRQGARVPLALRGRGPRGGWLLAAPVESGPGIWEWLAWEMPGGAEQGKVVLGGLVGIFPGADEGVEPASMRCAGGRLILQPAADTFFGPVNLNAALHGRGDSLWSAWVDSAGWVHQPGGQGMPVAALPVLGPLIRLGPEWWPLRGGLTMSLLPEVCALAAREGDRWGLFRRTGEGEWRWVGQERGAGLGATIDRLGDYALLEDRWAPSVGAILPPPGATLPVAPGRLEASIAEWGSGFDPRDADILLDGKMLIAAWDIDEKFLVAPVETPLEPGTHHWEVRVTDRVGQLGGGEFQFTVSPPATGVAGRDH